MVEIGFDAIGEFLSRKYLPDYLALAVFACSWLIYGSTADRYKNADKPSLLIVIHQLRMRWLVEMQNRDMRMPDIQLLLMATSNYTFFASTSIFVIAGLAATLAAPEVVRDMIGSMPFMSPSSLELVPLKVYTLIGVFAYSFFMFTWSIRQNSYCGVVICAVPTLPSTNPKKAWEVARKLAPLFTLAGNHFNHGLRAYYFGLSMLVWFVNPYFFIVSTLITVYVLWHREFRSKTMYALQRAERVLSNK